jgi:rhodanese-related sulfurtransferase
MFAKVPRYFFFNKILNLFKSNATTSTPRDILISAQDAHKLLHKPNVKFLDIRDPEEYKKSHIPGAYSANLIFTYLAKSDAAGIAELKKNF